MGAVLQKLVLFGATKVLLGHFSAFLKGGGVI